MAMRTPPHCFDCGEKLDDFTAATEAVVPDAGAVSLCFYCGAAAVFTGNGLELRRPTSAERDDFDRDPEIAKFRRMLAEVR